MMTCGRRRTTPVTGIVAVWLAVIFAKQFALVPPFVTLQLQLQGPVPVTVDAVPDVQRLALGAVVTVVALALPQVALLIVTEICDDWPLQVIVAIPAVIPEMLVPFTDAMLLLELVQVPSDAPDGVALMVDVLPTLTVDGVMVMPVNAVDVTLRLKAPS